MKRLLVVIILLLNSCAAAPSVPSSAVIPTPSVMPSASVATATPPVALDAALFHDYWQSHGGNATLGDPVGMPVFLDGAPTQLYRRGMLVARPAGIASVPLPASWSLRLPEALATLSSSPYRATLSAPVEAMPLAPLDINVAMPGYAGQAAIRIFDGRGRFAGEWPLTIANNVGAVTIRPGGALGAHSALVIVDGAIAGGASLLYTLDAQTSVVTGQERFDMLYPAIRRFMEQCVLEYTIDGILVRGYRSPDNPLLWLRDHTYQARGFRYFDPDAVSLIDAFRHVQQPNGSFPDFLARPEMGVLQPGRKQVEADVEYLFVQAVYEAWQVTGDDDWLRANLAAMRRAVAYSMSDPLRWDAEHQLVKRAYTIDTWDFAYGPTTVDPTTGKPAPRHWIDDQTIWGIFHGDNTGLASALELLARAEDRVGDPSLARKWRDDAKGIMERLDALSWNGRFYTHFVPLQPFDVPGVDEASQLSLSNAYALNRGVLRRSQARAIVEEYFQRGLHRGKTFAEWYSINPPFPAGSFGLAGRPGEKPGEYVNGGIMPLVGGELARGAFRYGAEQYAFEILHRYYFLISATGATYLWYYPEGNPGISGVDTLPTDGWGASAMLAALIEGAAGIEDRDAVYRDIRLSPRWMFAEDVQQARVTARYAASDGYVAYEWRRLDRGVELVFTGSGDRARVRLPLPAEVGAPVSVRLNGNLQEYQTEDSNGSRYIAFDVSAPFGVIQMQW